ncbi:YggT family protein [Salirhabdus sp. Marseille-P4669]|uniref:YggT family protein n=1 Tax=Salirhabdus sp. Marseille-P4669 TaxID=2042310 RepID=UPI000C7ADC5A|nr:YggT family protein [Salirhabdus sp. Marseille-P4669]
MDLLDIYQIIYYAIQIYIYLVIIYILMSWFPGARESSFGQIIGRLVEPYLEPFRKLIPPIGMIDISPIVAIFALQFALIGLGELFQMILF